MAEMNRERLEVRRVKAKRALSYQKRQILLCAGTGCIAGGSLKLYDYFKEECARRGMDVYVGLTQENEMEDVTEPQGGRSLSEKERLPWLLRDGASGPD